MLSTIELLDLAKERQGGVTDYRISKLLGVSTQHVTHYRRNGVRPSNPIAMRLGELAGVDPVEAVIAVNLERASTDAELEVWRSLHERLKSTAGPESGH